MLRDDRSEAPDVINAVHRLGHVALLRLAAAVGGDGLLGGVLPGTLETYWMLGIALALLSFLHRLDFSRIHDVGMLELRENWAMPVIFAQVWAMTKLFMIHPALCGKDSWEFISWRWAFRLLTVLCILVWQFSAFAFLLQVSAAFLCTLLACHNSARSAMMELLNSHLVAVAMAAALLFGNELLVQHLLVTQCIAIKVVLSVRKAPSWRLLFWLDGALAVVLFLVLRVLQMPFATADEHVWELYANKMRTLFPSYLGTVHKEPTFNTRLYNAVSVFDFISWKNIEVGFQTKVYQIAAVAVALQIGTAEERTSCNHQGMSERGRFQGYAHVFGSTVLLVQTGLFLVLGCFISRLKCIGVPFLLLFVAVAVTPKPLAMLLGQLSRWRLLRQVFEMLALAAVAAAQLGYVAFLSSKMPFIEQRYTSLLAAPGITGSTSGFKDWEHILLNIPEKEIVLAAMPLSAELRRATPSLRIAIHPQFEAQHLRDRVQELYQFYQCTSPETWQPKASFAKTMKKFQSRFLILEFKRCSFGPFLLDRYPEVNCKEGEHPWHYLFCPRALASPLFELLWANAEFAVLRLRHDEEVPQTAKSGNVEDLKTWEPMLQRCQEEERRECSARVADLALAFRKMGQSQVSKMLLRWAETHHLDYDLQQSEKAGAYYRKAVELEPNNPVFVKEYLMWLEIVAKDQRSLVRLLGPRRTATGAKLALTDLGDAALACEAKRQEIKREIPLKEALQYLLNSIKYLKFLLVTDMACPHASRANVDDPPV
ncbi:C-mannosyltransferase dpy-19 (Protein dumpy-19) [Durusdinium trenchii]|uniref:C-mannosyltransferase dpy-19 (Protein dumpy-19) n=1 Tax=Durusdinium trenchii TaxID=1381693 RepID=A0ABP0J525_9DINO